MKTRKLFDYEIMLRLTTTQVEKIDEQVALAEMATRSSMIRTLILEALAARAAK